MKFSAILLGTALYLFSSVEAGITTNTPFNSVTWNGGDTEKVEWDDDGKAPNLAKIGTTSIDLMAGGDVNQVLVANIGKVPATAKEIDFTVPKNVGPPGDFYFIKYTAGTNIFFSGKFSIAKVNGNVKGLDPKNPNAKVVGTTPDAAKNATTPGTPPATTPATGNPSAGYPNTGGYANADPKPDAASPTSSSPAAAPTAPTTNAAAALPNSISSDASNSLPSFAGVATAAIAFAFTYLY